MNELNTHKFHFEKQMKLLYKNFSRFIIPSRMFETMGVKPMTFSFCNYQTLFHYKSNGILFYTRPVLIEQEIERIPLLDPDAHNWLLIDKKIEEFAIKGKI